MVEILNREGLAPEEVELVEMLKNSKQHKVLKFGAEWCPPCRAMKPVFEEYKANNPEIDFYDLDLGGKGTEPRYRIISAEFQIYGIPALYILDSENRIIQRCRRLQEIELFKEVPEES